MIENTTTKTTDINLDVCPECGGETDRFTARFGGGDGPEAGSCSDCGVTVYEGGEIEKW